MRYYGSHLICFFHTDNNSDVVVSSRSPSSHSPFLTGNCGQKLPHARWLQENVARNIRQVPKCDLYLEVRETWAQDQWRFVKYSSEDLSILQESITSTRRHGCLRTICFVRLSSLYFVWYKINTADDRRLSLFITHCGQGSTTEASTAGVPLIVIPVLGDQMRNAQVQK